MTPHEALFHIAQDARSALPTSSGVGEPTLHRYQSRSSMIESLKHLIAIAAPFEAEFFDMHEEGENTQEFTARFNRLLKRAEEKYGDEALTPQGMLKADAFDYAINEYAGMPRYVEMLRHRLVALGQDSPERATMLRTVEEYAKVSALLLIGLRRSLLESGCSLGTAEHSEER